MKSLVVIDREFNRVDLYTRSGDDCIICGKFQITTDEFSCIWEKDGEYFKIHFSDTASYIFADEIKIV